MPEMRNTKTSWWAVHRFVGASYGGAFLMMPRQTCFDDNISGGTRTFYAGNAEYPITMGGWCIGLSVYHTVVHFGRCPVVRVLIRIFLSEYVRFTQEMRNTKTSGGWCNGLSVHHTVVHFGRCPVERVSMIIFLLEYVRYTPEMRNTKTSGGRGIGDAAPYGYGYGYGYGCGYGGWGGFGVSVI